jgi:hypothetical protein
LSLQPFSALKRLFDRFRNGRTCRCLHQVTYYREDRVQAFNTKAPDCMCEQHRTSKYSKKVVGDGEILARFVFSPIHFDNKKSRLKPSLFSHAENKGCSIQRESIATTEELRIFVSNFLRNGKFEWMGVVTAQCEKVRAIRIDGKDQKTVCVYDTAEKVNPAHAEIGLTNLALEEADANEMRRHLMLVFNCDSPISPRIYRKGGLNSATA